MKKIFLEVVKICAVGCDKAFITILYDGKEVTFMTKNRGLYDKLKSDGAITSQSLRGKKNEIKKIIQSV